MEKMRLEKHFLNVNFIQADKNYITDGNILIHKKYCGSSIINKLETMDSIFEKCKTTIPFEKGEEFEINVGTKCELYTRNRIGIIYNERYLFDYYYVKMIMEKILYYDNTMYVVVNNDGAPILKIFVKDEFAGLIMPIDKEG